MKIIAIDAEKTNDKQVAYVTDPLLTEEVYVKYSQMVGQGNLFKFKDGSLISQHHLDAGFLKATADHFTQVERKIQSEHDKAEKAREEFLQELSKQSGLPIRKKPLVADPAGSSGDANQK
jgi:hypothetical protein